MLSHFVSFVVQRLPSKIEKLFQMLELMGCVFSILVPFFVTMTMIFSCAANGGGSQKQSNHGITQSTSTLAPKKKAKTKVKPVILPSPVQPSTPLPPSVPEAPPPKPATSNVLKPVSFGVSTRHGK